MQGSTPHVDPAQEDESAFVLTPIWDEGCLAIVALQLKALVVLLGSLFRESGSLVVPLAFKLVHQDRIERRHDPVMEFFLQLRLLLLFQLDVGLLHFPDRVEGRDGDFFNLGLI